MTLSRKPFTEAHRRGNNGAVGGTKITRVGNRFLTEVSHRRAIDLGETDPAVIGTTAERD